MLWTQEMLCNLVWEGTGEGRHARMNTNGQLASLRDGK